MPGKLLQEIAQAKPWTCREEEAFLNIARTYEYLAQTLSEFFREYHLSMTQYNMLRILRGAGPEGLNCTEAARRMITHDPDVTRLFDRLEVRRLILRKRSSVDRRVVLASITEHGLELLSQMDEPLCDLHVRQMAGLTPEKLETLIEACEALRP